VQCVKIMSIRCSLCCDSFGVSGRSACTIPRGVFSTNVILAYKNILEGKRQAPSSLLYWIVETK
jgi:hypothetical protein